jgi:hypothetical protein
MSRNLSRIVCSAARTRISESFGRSFRITATNIKGRSYEIFAMTAGG